MNILISLKRPLQKNTAIDLRPESPFVLTPGSVAKCLGWVAAAFALINVGLIFYRRLVQSDIEFLTTADRYFNLNGESAVPSQFSFLLLLFSAVLCAFVYFSNQTQKKAARLPWIALACVFLFLSFDEVLGFHETYGHQVGDSLIGKKGIYFSWVVPYAILCAVTAAVFARFVFGLPAKTRLLFFVAGAVYVAGAIGMEVVGGYIVKHLNSNTWQYSFSELLEETMEMTGIIVFIYALLDYIVDNKLKFVLRNERPSNDPQKIFIPPPERFQ